MRFLPNADDYLDAELLINTVENEGTATPLDVMRGYFHKLGLQAIRIDSLEQASQKMLTILNSYLAQQQSTMLSLTGHMIASNHKHIVCTVGIFEQELAECQDLAQNFDEWAENIFQFNQYKTEGNSVMRVTDSMRTAIAQTVVDQVIMTQKTDLLDIHTDLNKAQWLVKVAVRCIKNRMHAAVLQYYAE